MNKLKSIWINWIQKPKNNEVRMHSIYSRPMHHDRCLCDVRASSRNSWPLPDRRLLHGLSTIPWLQILELAFPCHSVPRCSGPASTLIFPIEWKRDDGVSFPPGVFTWLPPQNAPFIACVASVFVRFRSKERETRVKDRAKNRESRPSVFLCSETKRKRLLRRLYPLHLYLLLLALLQQLALYLFRHRTHTVRIRSPVFYRLELECHTGTSLRGRRYEKGKVACVACVERGIGDWEEGKKGGGVGKRWFPFSPSPFPFCACHAGKGKWEFEQVIQKPFQVIHLDRYPVLPVCVVPAVSASAKLFTGATDFFSEQNCFQRFLVCCFCENDWKLYF